jgi:transcriptional regulator with XRE-family HTH domain
VIHREHTNAVNPASPTVRRRRLAAELRKLRERSSLTADQVAKEVGISKSTLSRIENAQVSVMVPVARSLLTLYGVASEDIEALVQIARDARQRGWWHAYDQVLPEWFSTYVGLEAEATEIKTLETQLVPGLLQTPDYARAVIAAEHPDSPVAEIDRRVELRMRRQELDSPPRLWAILDESVLRRPIGGTEVMSRQIERLLEAGARPRVNIQVIPCSAGEYGSMSSSFSILSFAAPDDGVVYLEYRSGALYLDGDQQVAEYRHLFSHLTAVALAQRESAAVMKRALTDLGR